MKNKLKNLTSLFQKNEILVIDLSDDVLRAVVVQKEGRKVTVSAAEEMESASEYQAPGISVPKYQNIGVPEYQSASQQKNIESLLKKLGNYPRRVVLVSPEVKFLVSELPLPAGTKISTDKLQEAVRWEAQAYLDFSASEGLFGQQLLAKAGSIKEELFGGVDKTGKTTPVLITAVSRDIYSQLAATCKRNRLSLQAVYPKENIFSLDRFPPETTRMGPQYMSAVEAALQQLKIIASGKLGVNDKIPLGHHLKSRIHIFPLVTVGIFALVFLTHYVYLKSSSQRYSLSIQELEIEKGEIEGNISILRELESEIKAAYGQKLYLEEVLPAQQRALLGLFEGLIREIPDDVILDRISQDQANIFSLEGAGASLSSIMLFVRSLDRFEVTREAKLETMSEKRAERVGLLGYQFKVRVVLE